jgi:hypothetical protein
MELRGRTAPTGVPKPSAPGIGSVALVFATAGAAGVGAPTWVWIGTLIIAGLLAIWSISLAGVANRIPIDVRWRGPAVWGRGRVKRLRRIHVRAADASNHAGTVLNHICDDMHGRSAQSMYCAALTSRSVTAPLHEARLAFTAKAETRQPVAGTLQAFVVFYIAYQQAVLSMRDAGQSITYDFSADGNYGAWKRADTKFLHELDEVIAEDAVLRSQIRRHMWPDSGIRAYWS